MEIRRNNSLSLLT